MADVVDLRLRRLRQRVDALGGVAETMRSRLPPRTHQIHLLAAAQPGQRIALVLPYLTARELLQAALRGRQWADLDDATAGTLFTLAAMLDRELGEGE